MRHSFQSGLPHLQTPWCMQLSLLLFALLTLTRTSPLVAQTSPEKLPPAWLPEAEEILIVQDYPTLSTAAKGIGSNLRQTVGEVLLLADGIAADGIAIVAGDRSLDVETQSAIARAVQQEFPNHETRTLKSIDEAREKEICISVRLDRDTPDLVAEVLFPAEGQFVRGAVRVSYDDVKWLSSEMEFNGNQRIARSQRLGNIAEAKQQCTDHAVEIITKVAKKQAQRIYVDEGTHEQIPFDVTAEVRTRIERFVQGEFVQGLETRDGGTAFRCAMLLDLTELDAMFVELNLELQASTSNWWAWTIPYILRFGAVIGLLLAVTLIYLVLDGMTQGYYNGLIKTGLTVFGIVGLAILFLVTT